jgi:hypothetical protein
MISLPPDITFEKRSLPEGGWSYDFRHRAMGALGRILLRGLPDGRGTHCSYEVSGDPVDPRTAERRAVFEPIGMEIARQMERALGGWTDPRAVVSPPPPLPSGEVAESKMMQCRTYDAFVAMLVFAPRATDTGRFEDYARLMYPEYSRHRLPTWIVGPAFGPGPEDPADILEVWPVRKALQRLTPRQFNPRIDRLAARHCRPASRLSRG